MSDSATAGKGFNGTLSSISADDDDDDGCCCVDDDASEEEGLLFLELLSFVPNPFALSDVVEADNEVEGRGMKNPSVPVLQQERSIVRVNRRVMVYR